MTTTPTKPRRRRAKAAPLAPASVAEPVQWTQPPVGLSPVGEYLRRIADEHTPGAVQVDPHRQHGTPVLDETRIPVNYVLWELAAGKSWAEIASGYPEVTEDRIRAAIRFAAAVLSYAQAVDLE
jgi:uncharacterized protein (DUF433 family)